jgi:acyl-CoA synthetase (AMP-forming)/AMP-acid ligase II
VTTLTQAGGRLEPALVAHFAELMRRRGGRFHVMYGQTEATARIAVLPGDAAAERPGSVGRPIRDGHIAIDADGRAADPGEIGEIVYRGPNVMLGYATERADLSRGDELSGELRTGDLGFVDAEGYLHVTGRTARIAKVHGLRISLDEVEALARVDGPVAVIGGEDRLIVFYEGVAGDVLAARQRELSARLRIHASAISVRAIDAIPRAASGKVDYPRLGTE